jgi:two-component system, OmpR family, copper resistance phosphate regulon response regulator CusR
MKPHAPRILCIDNDPDICNWMRNVLWSSIAGCVVECAETGRTGFDLLNDQEFDLCILDYALPDMTGVQLCGLMRQMGCNVPIMFFSAMSRPIDKARAEAAGADEYICRPDDLNIFADKAIDLLSRRPRIYDAGRRFSNLAKAA